MMEKRKELLLYAGWICLYILCVGLGTVGNMEGVGKVFFVLTSLIFFLPGVALLLLGRKEKSRKSEILFLDFGPSVEIRSHFRLNRKLL